jgi:hypothetical protein
MERFRNALLQYKVVRNTHFAGFTTETMIVSIRYGSADSKVSNRRELECIADSFRIFCLTVLFCVNQIPVFRKRNGIRRVYLMRSFRLSKITQQNNLSALNKIAGFISRKIAKGTCRTLRLHGEDSKWRQSMGALRSLNHCAGAK